jgi:hypothetical protein
MKTLLMISLFTFASLSFGQDSKGSKDLEVIEDQCLETDGCEALSFSPVGLDNPEVSEAQADKAFDAADMVLKDIGRSIASEVEED